MRIWSQTSQGLRSYQEDRFLIDLDRGLLAVADGMGGHANGAKAAESCIQAIRDIVLHDGFASSQQIDKAFQAADRACRDGEDGRGSTLTVAFLSDKLIRIGHAGDSFAFLVEGGTGTGVRQLTESHEGFYGGLTNVVGFLEFTQIIDEPRKAGDFLILCTDGLEKMGSDLWITAVQQEDPAAWAVQQSLEMGSSDNLTCIVVEL
jgi:serine/threonine protein phosphatase PrpC